jgi:3-deoxy-D-manno-octulosonic-acid transferase
MAFLYSLAIQVARLSIPILALFNQKIALREKGIKEAFGRLKNFNPERKPVFWMHCASLGEFEQGRPLLEKFKATHPNHKIVLTFFSPSGYEPRKNYPLADLVIYLPWDTKSQAQKFAGLLKADIGVFVKYEIWPNIISECAKSGTRLFLVSARFRSEQHIFKPWGNIFRKSLKRFEKVFVQDSGSVALLESIGISAIKVGDTRYDRVIQIAAEPFSNKALDQWSERNFTIVAGSTWPQDERILQDLLKADSQVQILLAPHETSEAHLRALKELFGSDMIFLSELDQLKAQKVICVDSMGMLSKLYRFGRYAYVGGGFGKGIHNTLEAVVYGIPVVFGPKFHKFQEAHDLIEMTGAVSISNSDELLAVHHEWRSDSIKLREAGNQSLDLVQANRGATDKILKFFEKQ